MIGVIPAGDVAVGVVLGVVWLAVSCWLEDRLYARSSAPRRHPSASAAARRDASADARAGRDASLEARA